MAADHDSAEREVGELEVTDLELGDDAKLIVFAVPIEAEVAELTPAERAVVALVLEGCSNRQIAERRGASVKTVANQLRSVYQKLGVSSRFELVAQMSG